MNPARSVAGRLALTLLVVVGGALAIVYLIVVPSYQRSLVNSRLKDLRHTVALIAAEPRNAPGEVFPSDGWIQDVAEPIAPGVRIVIFNAPPLVEPVADSNGGTSRDVERDSIARRASAGTAVVSGSVSRGGSAYAEAAVSLRDSVLLVSEPLRNDLESVEVVRHRVILAASFATGFAIVLGYVLAALFARRIRRLEAAAERIADGRFDQAVVDVAPDELGQLARTFERMRLQLASLDRARAEFIANASHELRTPLFSLAGFIELLTADDEVDAETRDEFLATMREQVTRLAKLATDLLDLSRMDAGGLRVAQESVDLGAVGEALLTEFRPRFAGGAHSLELAVSEEVGAFADEARVLQIGRILVENALVHTPPGTAVRIAVGRDGGRALLGVGDDGPGIPADLQQAVFERFFRLGGTVASGSGLGLAIARELAELMSGRIELESLPGLTRFTLVLAADPAVSPAVREPVHQV